MSAEVIIPLPVVRAEDVADNYTLHVCTDCKLDKPRFAFESYPSGRRKPQCTSCHHQYLLKAAKRGRRKQKKKPKRAPHPCRQCGKAIERMAPQSRVNNLKFCSKDCRRDNIKRGRKCSRCGVFKKYDDFNVYQQVVRKRPQCISCEQKNRYRQDGRQCMRPTLAAMIEVVKRMAVRRNRPFYLTEDEALKMYEGPCEFCGGQVQFFLPRERATVCTRETLRPVCRRCHRMIKHFGITEMLCAAYEITAFNGLTGKPKPKEFSHAEDA